MKIYRVKNSTQPYSDFMIAAQIRPAPTEKYYYFLNKVNADAKALELQNNRDPLNVTVIELKEVTTED